MTNRLGIDDFGRVGRLAMRGVRERVGLEVLQVNAIAADAQGSAHLLKCDSQYGVWPSDGIGGRHQMQIDGQSIYHTENAEIGSGD